MDPFRLIDLPLTIQVIVHLAGLYLAINALFQSRTPQGATAWFIGLLGFPYLAIPLFIVFGRRRYHEEPKESECQFPPLERVVHRKESLLQFEKFLGHTGSGFVGRNNIELIVDGESIYRSMLDEIQAAKEYIILQVYIFRTDEVGRMFAEALKEKARAGVKVYLLYEKVLVKMSEEVIDQMIEAGVHLGLFNPFRRNKWHLNFRNHRKILVVDGRVGFFGGLNIGDDYIGKYPEIGHWRDTNVRICGPALVPAQRAFAKDWLVSQGHDCDIDWKAVPTEGLSNVMIFSSGPVEEKPMCLLHYIALVDLSTRRLWIANPYLVPPQSLLDALAMASLRGVDVRVLVPERSDNIFIATVQDIHLERLLDYGIRVFRYQGGFLHQKVMLIDDTLGVVGSANLDFRSMFINFEITTACTDPSFISDMESMLNNDFRNSREIFHAEIKSKPTWRKIWERGVNLLSPVL